MAPSPTDPRPHHYLIEHLDPEISPWSTAEYASIANETHSTYPPSSSVSSTPSKTPYFILSSVPPSMQLPAELQQLQTRGMVSVEHRSVEEMCWQEGEKGEGKLWRKERVCLLDPKAEKELEPKDGEVFDAFLFGGILGDDPPRDRTSELRCKGFPTRRLGPLQMTTDTAVRVTRLVVASGIPVDQIPYIDYPEIKINKHETTEMPFRYVKDERGKPAMPEGMDELIAKDSDKGFAELMGDDGALGGS
ncbi:DUF431-domain-containing protein [Eremomyces bilateralis CBS 781.70]|uniref:DUF431-domain-containing protein n=1 Tax=Eremomyces bilateralis CBS 781.70 TaxID=1392243 RepID=A0A6G1FZB0_9PEZI|nr:DUF431-domain-containing protein [Eremomyces bilateralis CBS 781.70]KAF1811118.1 DUF431-domain-containing protein [Eremomyces bilateralis CBS 781.70]